MGLGFYRLLYDMGTQCITIKLQALKPRNKELNDILRSKRSAVMAPVKDAPRLSERRDIQEALQRIQNG